MNPTKLLVATLGGFLVCAQSASAAVGTLLPVEDGGLLIVAAVGLAVAIKIARWKQKR